jgi:poly-gamma-glutamate capsule biosynthesis protein CapA/YwtB (metallophosphatase superfamily)
MQGTFTLTLTGQAMVRGDVRVDAPHAVADIESLVEGDAAFTNYEATVYDPDQGQSTRDGRFVSPPESMDALASLGFNLMSTANNHSYDMGAKGILNTVASTRRLGIAASGTGGDMTDAATPAYLTSPSGTVALVSSASGLIGEGRAGDRHPGVNELRLDGDVWDPEDADRILGTVARASQQADLVVVSHHNHHYPGVERPEDFKQLLLSELPARLAPPDWLPVWAHELVDAGADVVAMHGPPFLHGMEVYSDKPIFYSLGNFIFQVPPESVHLEEPIMWESLVAHLDFVDGTVAAIRLQPIGMNKVGSGLPNPHDEFDVNEYHRTRGLPRAVSGKQAQFLLERFARFSEPFGVDVHIEGAVAEVRLGSSAPVAPDPTP